MAHGSSDHDRRKSTSMTMDSYAESSREAVGVFKTAGALQAAADELLSSGFDRADLSLLASEHAVEEKLGHLYRRVEELEDDPQAARAAYVARDAVDEARGALISGLIFVGAVGAAGAMVAAGGALAGTILAAAALGGAGGLIGSTLGKMLEQHHADHLHAQLEKGGLLLWVRTRDSDYETRAAGIMRKHGAIDVHIHELSPRPA
jgi:hypothetical protein